MRTSVRISAGVVPLLLIFCVVGTWTAAHAQAVAGQKLNADGEAALNQIIGSARHPDLRWADFPLHQAEVKDFYARTDSTLVGAGPQADAAGASWMRR